MSKSLSLSTDTALRRQPQQKRGQKRVGKILIAAAEVFAEGGYAAATIQQIAERASTAVGSIYQFFPDKSAIFQALKAESLRQGEILEKNFFDADMHRPLIQIVSEFINTQANYLDSPIARCIVLQSYLKPISELFTITDKMPDWESIQIEKHANLYRQRNPNLSQVKSKLLSEVSHSICHCLFLRLLENDEQHHQHLYAEIKDVLYNYLNPHIGDHLVSAHNNIIICPDCQSDRVAKNGRQQSKQRYICQGCGRQFINHYTERGYSLEVRKKCLDLHQKGVSFREIERCIGISRNTVINWVKNIQ